MKKNIKKLMIATLCGVLMLSVFGCGGSKGAGLAGLEDGKFPAFEAQDLNGNKYNQEMFKENAVTVLNVWFTGCQACIQEMPELEKLNQSWKDKNIGLVGLCTDLGTKETDAEAKKIAKANKLTYPNLQVSDGEKINQLKNSIVAFPTTLLIDRNGKVVGEPIVGALDSKEKIDNLNKKIDDIIAKDGGK